MKKLAALALSLFLTMGTALADTPKDSTPQPAKPASPAKPKAAKNAEKSDAAIAAQLEELRQALQSQQEQLQLLKEELAKRDRQIDEAREAAAAANARAAEASTKATEAVNTTAEVKTAAATLNTTVSDLKASNEILKTTVATEQEAEKKAEETGPPMIKYKGVSLTPGGFIAAETAFRQRAESADVNSQFNGIPYPGSALGKVNENVFSARQTRATLLAESKVGPAKLSGYFEMDFLGAGTTSNNRQSSSYVFRQRQLWAQAAFDSGFSITGGQMWSLAVENRKGIQNRVEALPMMVDPQYVVGFTWQRADSIRVTQSLLENKVTLGVSIEGPQTTLGGRGFSTFTNAAGATSQNFWYAAPGNGGGLNNAFDPTGYTPNKAPDVVFKAALDPGFGHYEIFGILSQLRARIYPCAVVSDIAAGTVGTTTYTGPQIGCAAAPGALAPTAAGAFNDSRTGGGGGASFRVPLFAKKLDFGVKGVYGAGIGRFGSSQLADATARPDGTLAPIRTGHGLGILEFHPNAKLDIFAYGGAEYAARAAYGNYASVKTTVTTLTGAGPGAPLQTTTTVARSNTGIGGYGNRAANNTGCSAEAAPVNQLTPNGGGTCAGDTRVIIEGTLGFWHKIYQGPKGGFRWGMTYSYLTRTGWSGAGGLPAGSAGISPKAVDNMVWTSFRYYLP